jgi:hypothetical protein
MEEWREIRLGNIGYTVGKLLGACELPRILLPRTPLNRPRLYSPIASVYASASILTGCLL